MTKWLGWLAVLGVVVGWAMGFLYAPKEVTQGNVQRIMYLHVPSILTAYLAFSIVFVAALLVLWKRSQAADRWSQAACEIGVIFTGITLVSGSIWGKPTWGTWWTWDARLTSTAVLFLIYVGALLLRGMVDDPERGGRYAAVIGIIGGLNIPIVHFSVTWWRTLHQPPTILGPERAPISATILWTLIINWIALTLLFAYLMAKRIELRRLEENA